MNNPDARVQEQPFTLGVRIGQIIFLSFAVAATLGLAYWQWTSWKSGGGSFQNLGYAIQWPIFGACLVVAYRKYIHYEKERRQGNDQAALSEEYKASMREVPSDFYSLPTGKVAESVEAVDDRRRRRRA